jgi:hypothetical protein
LPVEQKIPIEVLRPFQTEQRAFWVGVETKTAGEYDQETSTGK